MTGAASVFMTVTGSAGLNALTFDAAVYVSNSFQGIIWKTGAGGGAGVPWVTDPLLVPNGVPPFGANGLGFNKAGNALFVANTANDQIINFAGDMPGEQETAPGGDLRGGSRQRRRTQPPDGMFLRPFLTKRLR